MVGSVLKDVISDNEYYNLGLLVSSLRLLYDKEFCKVNVNITQQIIDQFVEYYPQIFSLKMFITMYIH